VLVLELEAVAVLVKIKKITGAHKVAIAGVHGVLTFNIDESSIAVSNVAEARSETFTLLLAVELRTSEVTE
jgi:hypothetical protein